MRRTGHLLVVLLLLAPTVRAAQNDNANKSQAAGSSADADWQSLKNLGQQKSFSLPANASPVARQQTLQQLISSYVDEANALRDFYTKNPTHSAVADAKRLEAKSLLFAWQAGDASPVDAVRRTSLVTTVRKDNSLPTAVRSEVAALADNIGVEKTPNLTWPAKLAAYEQVARQLTTEFPDVPDAFEALLHIAKGSADDRQLALAADLSAMPGAPTWVKNEAKEILIRYALLGKSVVEPTRVIIAENNPFVEAVGRPLVIYTWLSAYPPSIAQAQDIAQKAPARAAIIGICLDQRDLTPARAQAMAGALPGRQIYDWLGPRGEIAEVLGAVDPGLVYIADASGILRSVSAQRNLAAALAALPAQ